MFFERPRGGGDPGSAFSVVPALVCLRRQTGMTEKGEQ